MFHAIKLELLKALEHLKIPALDHFVESLTLPDVMEFCFILIPIVWLGKSWRAGVKFLSIFLLSGMANDSVREFFQAPRSFQFDANWIMPFDNLKMLSGATQVIIILAGILFNFWKSRWRWFLVCSYVPIAAFSRVYLGTSS